MERVGMGELKKRLAMKRVRVLTRYQYYEMKNGVRYFRGLIPPEMQWMASTLGWCGKAVDALADRLAFRGFQKDNFGLDGIYQQNNFDILPDSAIRSALIASCCFIYIAPDMDGWPEMQVIDGGNATGVIDTVTGLMEEGYAVLERDQSGRELVEAYFTPERIEYYREGRLAQVITHAAPYALLVPIVYKPDAARPFGHSRISRSCMSLQQGALRTILRSEVSAEFYSFPQKWVSGLAEDAEMDKWKATISSMLTFTKDEDGDSPKFGQFQQATMGPYIEQMRMFASLFAGETGLTLDDLGFVTDNPSSADAIKAAHENLRLAARRAQKTFNSGFINAGFVAACVRDKFPYKRGELYQTRLIWEPVFEPDAAMLSSIGDGAIKINQAVPGYFGKENLHELTGIEPED